MKNFKKLMALVIAGAMVVGSMSMGAFAATGERTVDTSVTISGLEDGDTVKLYKVIGWEDSEGWKVEDDFAGITYLETQVENNDPIAIDTGVVNDINSKITASMTPANGAAGGNPTNKSYTWTVPAGEEGMYIAIVTPAKPGVVYSPMIVSADYDQASSTSVDASHSNIPGSAGVNNEAVAKKSEVKLDKTASNTHNHDFVDDDPEKPLDDETVTVGDTLTFTVKTTIPPFAGYKDPSFVLSDVMSTGLDYDEGSITWVKPSGAASNADVTNESATGYTVTFKPEYLKTVATTTDVEFTYTAKVTSDAVKSVNHENNTITLEYSNNPNNGSDKTRLRDRTNHYSFTIDGNLLGHDNYSATEVVKIGLSADGVTEITKTTTLSNGGTVGALEGAHFALYEVDEIDLSATTFDTTGKTPYSNKDSSGATVSYADITSGADGRINIKGIDGGKYVLIEKTAPAGYIKQTKPVWIEIIPTITSKTYTETDPDGVQVEVTTNELTSYVVKIDGTPTASYTITNSAVAIKTSSDQGDNVVGKGTDAGKIKNTQGVELPSTGGMGTTLFYTIGAILVLGAGILLVSKRRMAAN